MPNEPEREEGNDSLNEKKWEKFKARMDDLGIEWKKSNHSEDVWIKIWVLAFNYYYDRFQNDDEKSEINRNAFVTVLEEVKDGFDPCDPETGKPSRSLALFLSNRIRLRISDIKKHNKRHAPAGSSIDQPVSNDEDDSTIMIDTFEDPNGGNQIRLHEEWEGFDESLHSLAAMILLFLERRNKTRTLDYYRLIFTSNLVTSLQDLKEAGTPFFGSLQHERDIFRVIGEKSKFIDYCLCERDCRSSRAIYNAWLRKNEYDPNTKQYLKYPVPNPIPVDFWKSLISLPIPNLVAVQYLADVEGNSITWSAYSQVLQRYREDVLDQLQLVRIKKKDGVIWQKSC